MRIKPEVRNEPHLQYLLLNGICLSSVENWKLDLGSEQSFKMLDSITSGIFPRFELESVDGDIEYQSDRIVLIFDASELLSPSSSYIWRYFGYREVDIEKIEKISTGLVGKLYRSKINVIVTSKHILTEIQLREIDQLLGRVSNHVYFIGIPGCTCKPHCYCLPEQTRLEFISSLRRASTEKAYTSSNY